MSLKRVLKVAIVGPVLAVFGGCDEDRSIAAPVVATFDGTRMKPAVLVYDVRNLVGETQSGDTRAYAMRIGRATLDGAPAWVQTAPPHDIAHVSPMFPDPFTMAGTDTIYYDARTLTPVRSATNERRGGRWVWERRDGLVRLAEAPEWVLRIDDSNKYRANYRRLVERQMREPAPTHRAPDATVGPAPLELLTPGMPLDPEWRGAIDVHPAPVSLAWRGGRTGPTNVLLLAVTGTRTVTTPAGTFDAWVLRGTAPSPRQGDKALAIELWVDRKDGWMLRLTTTRIDEDGDPWTSETILREVKPLGPAPHSED